MEQAFQVETGHHEVIKDQTTRYRAFPAILPSHKVTKLKNTTCNPDASLLAYTSAQPPKQVEMSLKLYPGVSNRQAQFSKCVTTAYNKMIRTAYVLSESTLLLRRLLSP